MSIEVFSAGILVADHLCAPISHFPAAGELVLAESLPLHIGGCAANTALDLARLGVNVSVLGCVGDDPFGAFVRQTLSARGIGTQHILTASGVGTSGTLIVNVRGQDRRFIHAIGANACLRAEDIPVALITSAKVFYVGGYLLMPGLKQDGLAELFRQARDAGVKTVLDVVLPGPGDHWSQLERLLTETDYFLPNSDEAAAITGESDPWRAAQRFLAAGAGATVITCGERGTVFVSHRERLHAGVYPTNYVGGTGAGDAFDAGVIMGLLRKEDARGCLRWGSALGASCVRGVGATETVFTRAEAEEFMACEQLAIAEA